MPLLEDLLAQLEPSELQTVHASLKKADKQGKELVLLELLTSGESLTRDDLMSRLYKEPNRNAFDNIRKRLIKRIFECVVSEMASQEDDPLGYTLGLMMLCHRMAGRRAPAVVLHFAAKAEEIATRHHMYAVLEGIYNFLMQHAYWLGLDIGELARKQDTNHARYDNMRRLDAIITRLEVAVHEKKTKGLAIDPEELLHQVHTHVPADAIEDLNPAFQVRLLGVLRKGMVSTKEYNRLLPLLVQRYEALVAAGAFNKNDRQYEPMFLYMIAHAYYRNSRFDDARAYLASLEQALPSRQAFRDPVCLKFHALSAAVESYSGNHAAAAEILEGALYHQPEDHHLPEWHNIELSLVVVHFHLQQWRKAIRLLHRMRNGKHQLAHWMGREWCLKMDMIEALTHFENGNTEGALSMLDKIKYRHGELLLLDRYANTRQFLRYTAKIMRDPEVATTPRFRSMVKGTIAAWEGQQHDVQARAFFMWMKVRMEGPGVKGEGRGSLVGTED
jgi:hypothetical protein